MSWRIDKKAVSILVVIILIMISAIIGGIISYAFTIAYYTKTAPAITITNIYINKEDVASFTICVLNPSNSPRNATISRIAISLKGETQLYDVIETEPSIENGIVLQIGESRNITCKSIRKENANLTLGDFIGIYDFAGKTMIVHIFSSDFPAASKEVNLPYVKLDITEDFNSKYSFKKFNITLTNDHQSEINITLSSVLVWSVSYSQVDPPIEGYTIPIGESVRFNFIGNWYGVTVARIDVYTKQGYNFRKVIETKKVHAAIQSVNFDIERKDHFNVTVFNFAESAHYVNITLIKCMLDNETYIPEKRCDPPVGLIPNSTATIKFEWDWTEYRGRKITVVACFLQDFETISYTVTTPSPIIIKILNETSVFDLKDKEHFNITIQNHNSSLEAINVTKIVAKGVILNGTKADPSLPYGPIAPGDHITFTCDFNWASFVSTTDRNLTLTVHIVTSMSLKEYTFDFTFVLPVAELNITSVGCVEGAVVKYLNVTIKNMNYSLWNLTLLKIVIKVGNAANTLEYVLPKDQVTVNVGEEITLLCPFDWQKYSNEDIVITVLTDESVGTSSVYHIPLSIP